MLKLILSIVCTLHLAAFQPAPPPAYDVVVYGETVAGVSAAVQAARMGKKVVLLSQSAHIGGTTSSGLTATDMNRNTLVGGVAREFYRKIYAHYMDPASWRGQNRDSFFVLSRKRTYTGKNDSTKMQWVYESHIAERILTSMLEEANVDIVLNQKLKEEKGSVLKRKKKIVEIITEDNRRFQGKMFIDASYEGDLLKWAGVSHYSGREPNKMYGETLNGIRMNDVIGKGENSIDPYVEEGNPASGFLPFVDGKLWGKEGTADKRFQAFTYRVTLTNDPENRVPITKPANFNPLWHEVLVRRVLMNPETKLQQIITLTPMPNRKTDTNHLDFFGASFDYPEGSYAERDSVARAHRDYAEGMLWVLANDPRLPAHIRDEMNDWGWPKDEFTDNGHFPHQLYVREGRRMQGEFIMTEKHVVKQNRVHAPNSIGLGSYALDCHIVSRVVDENGKLRNEGSIFQATTPYTIPYGAIVPREKECTNLLVPVCLSASHVAFTTIRMEPVYMILGQSAGTAAAMAIDQNTSVQDVPYESLKEILLRDQQIISLPQSN